MSPLNIKKRDGCVWPAVHTNLLPVTSVQHTNHISWMGKTLPLNAIWTAITFFSETYFGRK